MSEHDEETLPPREEQTSVSIQQSAAFAGGTFVTMGLIDLVAHLGPTGLLVSGLASYVAWRHGPEVYAYVREFLPAPSAPAVEESAPPPSDTPQHLHRRSLADRAPGQGSSTYPAEEEEPAARPKEARDEEDVAFDLHGREDLPHPKGNGPFLFSSLLDSGFTPTLDRLFLARSLAGRDLTCTARELCHVALAGSTGGGKSSILRLLMAQLCSVRVKVLLLNPHYTCYDLDSGEDWTPFEPYLVHPPLACRSYEVIEHYLRTTAKDLIPKRLERRAHAQPVGQPYVLLLDELPSIVREISAAPDYLRIILEEGRKVGIFLVSAAQDFLVRSIAPKSGGGSLRECYRTAYYVGGDATTARVLLDMPSSLIAEDELGKGVAMLRSVPTKKAAQVLVPYVDNASLYRLLGPSTYQPAAPTTGAVSTVSRPVSPVSQPGNAGNGGNGSGNRVETAPEAEADASGTDPFPVSRSADEQREMIRAKLAVSPETLETIRRMKEAKYLDRDIAKLVGLAGRKYPVYQSCLKRLGYAKDARHGEHEEGTAPVPHPTKE